MPKLTPAQKAKARGIKKVRLAESRLAKKEPVKKSTTPAKGEKTKGITNIIKRRASKADRVFKKTARGG